MSSTLPLVTCIMPTRNRSRFVPRAIELFLRQDYPHKQLIIFEEESLTDIPKRDEIVVVQSDVLIFKSLGEKRNAMCTSADGYFIAHWDDDDWHSPRRLSTQIEMMRAQGARLCGADRLVFYDGEHARLFETPRKPWLAGGTLVYERSLWEAQPFNEVSDGEDTAFVDAATSRGVKVAIVTDESLYVAMLHDANTTKRDVSRLGGSYDVDKVREWMR